MPPKRGAQPTRGARGRPPKAIAQSNSALNTTEPPSTPVRQQGPFRIPQYKPPPLVNHPASPEGETFDFEEANAVPLTPSPTEINAPALGAMGSPVKRARARKGTQELVSQKGDLAVWELDDQEIIGMF